VHDEWPLPRRQPGGATLVNIDEAGLKLQKDILHQVVLKRWATRCPQCVDTWNETAGKPPG